MISDIIFSLAVYIICGIFFAASRSLTGGSESFPTIIIILLFIANSMNLIKRLKDKNEYDYTDIGRVILIFVVSIVYAFGIDILGFYSSTVIFVLSVILLLGTKNKIVIVLLPIGTALFTYLVFSKLFGIPIPTGIFF